MEKGGRIQDSGQIQCLTSIGVEGVDKDWICAETHIDINSRWFVIQSTFESPGSAACASQDYGPMMGLAAYAPGSRWLDRRLYRRGCSLFLDSSAERGFCLNPN